jgi:hypothetical protein
MLEVKAKMALKEWTIKWKEYNDSVAYAHRKSLRQETSSEDLDLEEHSGVLFAQLRTMSEVESSPLLVDHTFLLKELLQLCIAEEANFSGCQVTSYRSDDKRVQVIGCAGSGFSVQAVFSLSSGWKVTKAVTRGISPSKESQDYEVEVNGNEDDVNNIEEGEADGKSKHRTPLKTRRIFLLIKEVIVKTPNMSTGK